MERRFEQSLKRFKRGHVDMEVKCPKDSKGVAYPHHRRILTTLVPAAHHEIDSCEGSGFGRKAARLVPLVSMASLGNPYQGPFHAWELHTLRRFWGRVHHRCAYSNTPLSFLSAPKALLPSTELLLYQLYHQQA